MLSCGECANEATAVSWLQPWRGYCPRHTPPPGLLCWLGEIDFVVRLDPDDEGRLIAAAAIAC